MRRARRDAGNFGRIEQRRYQVTRTKGLWEGRVVFCLSYYRQIIAVGLRWGCGKVAKEPERFPRGTMMVEEKQQTLFPKTEQWRLKSTHQGDVLVNIMQGLLIRFIGGDLRGAIVSIC